MRVVQHRSDCSGRRLEPVFYVGDLGQDGAVLLRRVGLLDREYAEALLVAGLVLGNASIGVDPRAHPRHSRRARAGSVEGGREAAVGDKTFYSGTADGVPADDLAQSYGVSDAAGDHPRQLG